MSEKKQLNEKDLEKVSGGTTEYQEGWHIAHIYKNDLYCPVCEKTVDVVKYKEDPYSGYCAICHRFLVGFD